MAGKGVGVGEDSRFDNHILILKYCLVFFNMIVWMIAAAVFGLTMWMRLEPGMDEWVTKLELKPVYNGIYVLIALSVIVMLVSFLGCAAGLSESEPLLLIFVASQVVGFLLGMTGAALLLDNSTIDSRIQPMIRDSMKRLIMASGIHEPSRQTLMMVQENIGCCGADGPNDYIMLRQNLPPQCRDTVTGNTFFYGCVDELTWFFEEKAGWISGLTMTICFMQVLNIVMTSILLQANRREDRYVYSGYTR